MKKLILTSAAILVFGATAVQAQMQDDAMGDDSMSAGDMAAQDAMKLKMTPEQMTAYNGMTMKDKTTYDSFDRTQQRLFFALDAQQRMQLLQLDPTARMAAWTQIYTAANVKPGELNAAGSAMAAGAATSTARNQMKTGASGMAAGMASGKGMASNKMATSGALGAPPASASDKNYPTCSRTVTDNCTNPGRR